MPFNVFQIATTPFRDRLAEMLNRAFYAGHRFIITKQGKPVAALVPIKDYQLLAQLREQADAERLAEVVEAEAAVDVLLPEPAEAVSLSERAAEASEPSEPEAMT